MVKLEGQGSYFTNPQYPGEMEEGAAHTFIGAFADHFGDAFLPFLATLLVKVGAPGFLWRNVLPDQMGTR